MASRPTVMPAWAISPAALAALCSSSGPLGGSTGPLTGSLGNSSRPGAPCETGSGFLRAGTSLSAARFLGAALAFGLAAVLGFAAGLAFAARFGFAAAFAGFAAAFGLAFAAGAAFFFAGAFAFGLAASVACASPSLVAPRLALRRVGRLRGREVRTSGRSGAMARHSDENPQVGTRSPVSGITTPGQRR